jgi:threonine synthase
MKNKLNAQFRCIKPGCGRTYPLATVIYRCTACGSLLEVAQDLAALKGRSPEEWKKLMTSRRGGPEYPFNISGVWSRKEWVLPDLEEKNIVCLAEGHTHLFPVPRLAAELDLAGLHVKLCGNSHTGSFKDLGMTVLVSQVQQLIRHGLPLKAVACASTGDTSAALAAYAAAAGIPCVVLLPRDKISLAQLIQPVSNNSLVLSLDTDFDGCMQVIQEITTDPRLYLANSMNSLRVEGQKTISIEILEQLNWEMPDVVVIPGGNLGNVSALGKGFLEMQEVGLISKLPQIVVAQTQSANPLYLAYQTGFQSFHPVTAQPTLASAIRIGNPVSVEKAITVLKQFNGIVEQVTEPELADAAARGDRFGLFNCPHTGVALGALIKLRTAGKISSGSRVVVVSTAHGLKFTEFKVNYHQGTLAGITSAYANRPVDIEPRTSAVMDAINKRFGK